MREGLSSPFYHPSPNSLRQSDVNMSIHQVHGPGQPTTGQLSRNYSQHYRSLPGGGLYGISELPSPMSSFHQMSMVDSSTPTNMMHSRGGRLGHQLRGGDLRGDGSGVRDLNSYAPLHQIRLEDSPRRLFTVENNVTRETIVAVSSNQNIKMFLLKIKEEETKKPLEKFEFVKFHEIHIQPNDLDGFVLSQNYSITLAPFKLTYGLSTRGGNTVYVYDQGDSNQVPTSLNLGDLSQAEENSDSPIIQFQHDCPVTKLAIDAEKDYLACIEELRSVVVWDIHTKVKLAVFNISHQGARFFNVFRQCCFRSIHLVQPNVFAAEWSISNSNIFAAGFAESFTIVDTCKALSSMNKTLEVPEQIINAIKINPCDDKVFATLSRLTGTIQLWRDNFGTHIWKHQNPHVNDIAWVHGYPYLLALGHQTLFIYDCSMS